MTSSIHGDDPFSTPPPERDPTRQLRGRLASGVTVLTASEGAERAGLTVSSLLVLEGDPPRLIAAVNEATDLWEVIESTGRFVVHILTVSDRGLSEEFAGLRPAPGGPFASRQFHPSEWGPVLDEDHTRAYCTVERTDALDGLRLVVATIDRFELTDLDDPLLYFRGSYRRLQDDR